MALSRIVLVVFVLIAVLGSGERNDLFQYRVTQLAAPVSWALLGWEVERVPGAISEVARHIFAPVPPAEAVSILSAFFRGELGRSEEVSRALAALVSRELRAEQVPGVGGATFPPVLFSFSRPPLALIVSPRHEIRLAEYALLVPGLTEPEMEGLEAAVERLNVSALVAEIGGLSTYPTLIPPDTPPRTLVETVAHEWMHTRLFFYPLGRAYAQGAETRAINETTADIAGREIAQRVFRALAAAGPVTDRPQSAAAENESDIRRELRELRLAVDRMLAAGDITGAEALMEAERRRLEGRGYRIRRLNQAYFAFHGNYAEGPAATTEVVDTLRALRARSASLHAFLEAVGQVTSLDELRALARR